MLLNRREHFGRFEETTERRLIMKYRIVADTSSDLFELDGVDYAYASMKIVAGDRTWVDEKDMDVMEMVEGLKEFKGPSRTSCPNIADWLEAFGDADVVLGVSITSNLSGSYNAAMLAKNQYEEEHPGRKVYILDSLSAGPELKLCIDRMKEMILAEKPFEEMVKELEEYKKSTYTLFALEALDNLVKNGRVGTLTAVAAGVLGIRVIGTASPVGTIEQIHKCRGEKKTISTLYKEMKAHGYCGGKVKLDHVYNEGIAKAMEKTIRAEYPDAVIEIDRCGALCSFYAEMGGMIIGYEGEERA